MKRSGPSFSLASMLGATACLALNLWLFRIHLMAGVAGLIVSKHVLIAYLCQVVGVDRQRKNAA